MNQTSALKIADFLVQNPGVLIHPSKDICQHIALFNSKGKCPCDTMGTRLDCPCHLVHEDLKGGQCKCTLFIDSNYRFIDKVKEGAEKARCKVIELGAGGDAP